MNCYLTVDYEEFKPETYKGMYIELYEDGVKINLVSSYTGDFKNDEEIVLTKLYNLIGKVKVQYLSSYDDYLMDIDPVKPSLKDKIDTNRIFKKALKEYKNRKDKNK